LGVIQELEPKDVDRSEPSPKASTQTT
jgi:hypothetical protein